MSSVNKFNSCRIILRGFEDEGVFVYGTNSDMELVYKSLDHQMGDRYYDSSPHRTMSNARSALDCKFACKFASMRAEEFLKF